MQRDSLVTWLFDHSGPILRHRVALEWMDVSLREMQKLLEESLATSEAQCHELSKWNFKWGKTTIDAGRMAN